MVGDLQVPEMIEEGLAKKLIEELRKKYISSQVFIRLTCLYNITLILSILSDCLRILIMPDQINNSILETIQIKK